MVLLAAVPMVLSFFVMRRQARKKEAATSKAGDEGEAEKAPTHFGNLTKEQLKSSSSKKQICHAAPTRHGRGTDGTPTDHRRKAAGNQRNAISILVIFEICAGRELASPQIFRDDSVLQTTY